MIRKHVAQRHDWQKAVADDGLIWHTDGTDPYWREGTYYSFHPSEIALIEEATRSVYNLMLAAGDVILGDKNGEWLTRMGIPQKAHATIRRAWDQEPPALNYGRFDFGYDGRTEPKMFEFNCDTPTSLLEASVIQWRWKEQVFPALDQFNSIHEHLVAKWADIRPLLPSNEIHFTHVFDDAGEDTVTTAYLRDTAAAGGIGSSVILIEDIGLSADGRFVDLDEQVITTLFKLYPWEWLVNEEYADAVFQNVDTMVWLEPIWKMMWSNKGILPLLSKLDPTNPFLLHSSFEKPASGSYVKKPLLAREGANIEIVDRDVMASTGGDYGDEGYVYQEMYRLPETAPGVFPVIGSWIVDGEPCGMGIREDGLITKNTAKFVPHVIEG